MEPTLSNRDEEPRYKVPAGTPAVEVRLLALPECEPFEALYLQFYAEGGLRCLKVTADFPHRILILERFSGQWVAKSPAELPVPCPPIPRIGD